MSLTDRDTRSCLVVPVGFVHTSVRSLIPGESDFTCLPSQMAAASWPRPCVSNPCLATRGSTKLWRVDVVDYRDLGLRSDSWTSALPASATAKSPHPQLPHLPQEAQVPCWSPCEAFPEVPTCKCCPFLCHSHLITASMESVFSDQDYHQNPSCVQERCNSTVGRERK